MSDVWCRTQYHDGVTTIEIIINNELFELKPESDEALHKIWNKLK